MPDQYTAEQVLDTLAKVVDGKEDHVYRLDQRDDHGSVTCQYVEDDGSPSCIVGHVIAELDRDLFLLLRKAEADSGGSFSFGLAPDEILDRFDPKAQRALIAAQGAQDGGDSWGTAYLQARNTLV